MEEAIEVLVEEELGMNPTFGEGALALGRTGRCWATRLTIESGHLVR